jgi:hypothetical protein
MYTNPQVLFYYWTVTLLSSQTVSWGIFFNFILLDCLWIKKTKNVWNNNKNRVGTKLATKFMKIQSRIGFKMWLLFWKFFQKIQKMHFFAFFNIFICENDCLIVPFPVHAIMNRLGGGGGRGGQHVTGRGRLTHPLSARVACVQLPTIW